MEFYERVQELANRTPSGTRMSKEIRDQLRKLWAGATGRDIEDFARRSKLFSYKENIDRARKARERARKELARTE